MVFFESDGKNDFASIFPSVAEEYKEEEERRQTELFLQVLEDLESTRKTNNNRLDEGNNSRKEFMRVSITGDEEDNKKKSKDETDRNRVHTIRDLPQDDLFEMFGPPIPETPQVNIEAGRRLHDGKTIYTASLPGWFEDMQLGGMSFNVELGVLMILIVFLIGLWLGRRGSKRSRKTQQYNQPSYQYSQNQHQQHQQPQIIYAYPPSHLYGNDIHNTPTPNNTPVTLNPNPIAS